jgi:hypothetical protein
MQRREELLATGAVGEHFEDDVVGRIYRHDDVAWGRSIGALWRVCGELERGDRVAAERTQERAAVHFCK